VPYARLPAQFPYTRDAWYDPASVKVGYEINFNRYFYKPKALRTLEEIRAELLTVEKEAEGLLAEIISGSLETEELQKPVWRSGR
jgi:type I restriction enzyme M protein